MKLIDLHCDTIMKLVEDKNNSNMYSNDFSVDIKKLIKGNSISQFFALYVNMDNLENPLEYCLKMADRFHMEIKENNKYIALAKSYNDFLMNLKEEKISAFLTIEEGGVIKGELHNLRNFYRLGVRLMTLTWNYPNEIGFPNNREEYMNKGLTQFGIDVVKEMNDLGMIIDVSHLSDGGFYDVAKYSKKPFVASHSNARSVTNHKRNMTDDMIKTLANHGGIMGINFEKSFLNNSDFSKVDDMIKHIKHIVNKGGIETLAIGSDFDGISDEGLEIRNISEMDKLLIALEKNNFTDDEIEKIYYKNALRIIKEVL